MGGIVEDDHYDDYDEDEEYEEYDEEEEDIALAKKREEEKKAAKKGEAKQASTKARAAPAPKKTAAPAPAAPLTDSDKVKIEEDNRKMNYQLSAELFGGVELSPISKPDITLPNDQTFESFTPKTEAEYELFAQYIGGHLAVQSVR